MIIIYTIAFFLISLQDFYSYNLMLPIVSLIGSFLLIGICFAIYSISFSSSLIKLPAKIWWLLFSIYAMPLLCGLIVSSSFTFDFANSRLFSFFLLPFLVFSANVLFKTSPKKFILAFRLLLYLHLAFFFFNLIDIYFLGHIFDPISFFNDSQATLFTYVAGLPLQRACGLFQEPGTFATYYALLLAGYLNMTSRIQDYVNINIVTISVFALFLSLSVYGIIFGLVIYFWQQLYQRSHFFLRITQLFMFIPSLFYLIIRFFSVQLSIDSSKTGHGLEFRSGTITWLYDNLFSHPIHALFGFDILNPMAGYVDIGTSHNDSSMIIYFLLFTGIVGLVVFSISLIPFCKGKLPSILILLLSKLSLFAPISAIIVFAIFIDPIRVKPLNKCFL